MTSFIGIDNSKKSFHRNIFYSFNNFKICIMSPLRLRCAKVGKLRIFNLSS